MTTPIEHIVRENKHFMVQLSIKSAIETT